jgi:MFS family permease
MVSEGGRDAAGQPTRARYLIAVLLFVSVVINYLDRANLSVAAPQLAKDLGFDDAQKGWILAAFGWTYAALQVPGGWLVDKFPPRILYPLAIALWSLATVGLGFVGSVAGLIGLRLLVGALEAPSYPINSRVVTTWFPERERATAGDHVHRGHGARGRRLLRPRRRCSRTHRGLSAAWPASQRTQPVDAIGLAAGRRAGLPHEISRHD